jgi:hypothetical protein
MYLTKIKNKESEIEEEIDLNGSKFSENVGLAKSFVEDEKNKSAVIEFLKKRTKLPAELAFFAVNDVDKFMLEKKKEKEGEKERELLLIIIHMKNKKKFKVIISPLDILRLAILKQAKPSENLKKLAVKLTSTGFFLKRQPIIKHEKGYIQSKIGLNRLLRLTSIGNYLIILVAVNRLECLSLEHLISSHSNNKNELSKLFSKNNDDVIFNIIKNLFSNNTFENGEYTAKIKVIKSLLNKELISPLTICTITSNLESKSLVCSDQTIIALFYLESLYISLKAKAVEESSNRLLLQQKEAIKQLREQILQLEQAGSITVGNNAKELITKIVLEDKAELNGKVVLQKLCEAKLIGGEKTFWERLSFRL